MAQGLNPKSTKKPHDLVSVSAVVVAAVTVAIYAARLPANALWQVKALLLLVAFALALRPLWLASRSSTGGERLAWALLFAGAVVGLAGHVAGIVYRFAAGTGAEPARMLLPEIGFLGWILLMAVALALEVSSGHRHVLRVELVIDLLLIGTIGFVLAREIFEFLAPVSPFRDPFDLVVGSANVVVGLALAVAALGVLLSPEALGGGIARLLVVFGAFGAAVARMLFAYRLLHGEEAHWLEPAWILALLMIAAAGVERVRPHAAVTLVAPTSRWNPLRTMLVPVIVAYALSLLLREILVTGESAGPNRLAWAILAVLIVARVAVAILVSERQGQEISSWEHRYKTVVSALGEVVYEWDLETYRVLRSGNIANVFGYEPEELTKSAHQAFSMMHPEDRERAEGQFREAAERGGWFEIEYRIRHADGAYRLINDRGFCEHDDDGKPTRVLGLMSDITEQRESEERLGRAERLASLGGLAAGAAHEINNPLAAITLAAQMLQEDSRLPKDVLEDVRIIERQASRAGEVTERMLVFARRKEGERAVVSLNALVEEVLMGRRYDVETHGIKLQQDLQGQLPPVWVDAGQIERAVLNLLVNAERALTEVPEGQRLLKVGTKVTDKGAAVEVSDNGPGIPFDVLPRIFDPFFTTREVGEGTGLGLSMSYSIAQAHGGDLRVQTRPGEGSTFTLELPRAPEDAVADETAAVDATAVAARPAAEPVAVTAADGDSLRILLVDDEVSVRDLAKRFLEKRGHSVDGADSGSAALRLVSEGDYDSIVLDLRMPDLSGEGLYEWLRKNRPELAERVTVISADFANPQTIDLLDRMGRPYLLKPFDLEELLQLIEANAPSAASRA